LDPLVRNVIPIALWVPETRVQSVGVPVSGLIGVSDDRQVWIVRFTWLVSGIVLTIRLHTDRLRDFALAFVAIAAGEAER
jgi:hypothetical protein